MGIEIQNIVIQGPANSTLHGSLSTPQASDSLSLTRLGSYSTGSGSGSGEVFAYDAASQNLYVMNNITDRVEVVRISNAGVMSKTGEIDVSTIAGYAGMNSLAVANGLLAVAIESSPKSANGLVALFEVATGSLVKTIAVGALPDMLTFSPDGLTLIVANEGENITAAEATAGAVDAPGSVSIINLKNGAASATVTTVDFSALNGAEAQLRAHGVRLADGQQASIAIEPEYIAISKDGSRAFVTLQEANSVAILDLSGPTPTLKSIVPLGFIDHSLPGNESDFSDRDAIGSSQGAIQLTNQLIRGLPMPDAIATWQVDGISYFVTANEGDSRVDGSDEARLSSRDLDDAIFGAAEAALKSEDVAGRLTVSVVDGNTDADPALEAIYAFGGRGMSVFRVNADGSVDKIGETGGEFEKIIASLPNALTVFNGENNGAFDSRSDNKGPEPEGVSVATIAGRVYAFVALERVGGVMVYDLTTPSKPSFVTYQPPTGNDFAPEVISYIDAKDSPTGQGLVLTANEVSGSLTAYSVTPNVFTLQLLHFADGEAGLLASDTAPNLAALVDAFDGDFANTLILAGGDNFIPSPFLNAGADPSLNSVIGATAIARPDIAIHNAIGVQASAIGNHEWDLGSNIFADAIRPAGAWVGAQYPMITANLDLSGDSALRGLADASIGGTATNSFTGKEASTINGKIAPSAVVSLNGGKIGLVGATTQLIESISSPSGTEVAGFPTGAGPNGESDNMDLLAAQLQPVVNALLAQGINKIVLLSHLQQIANEQLLATKLTGVDVIVAAGSNTRLGDSDDVAESFPGHSANFQGPYPIATVGADGKPVLIVNTDNEYTYLGRLVVDFDAAGEVILSSLADNTSLNGAYAATTSNVAAAWGDLDGNLSDTAFANGTKGDKVRDIADAVQSVINAKDGAVFGYTNVYLEGERSFVRSEETNLGNLTADANAYVLWDGLGGGSNSFIVSLKNGGGIRAQIGSVSSAGGASDKLPPIANPEVGKAAGAVSQLDVENSLRFDNKLMAFDTNAQGLKALLEHAVAVWPNQGRFPQIGGVSFSWDPDLPANSRVTDIALIDDAGGVTLRLYDNGILQAGLPSAITVVTLNFIANNGDGYPAKSVGENFRFLLDNGGLSAPIDETLDFTAATVVPANAMGEQQALRSYLSEFHATPTTAFDEADTSMALDMRIQNLNFRDDRVWVGTQLDSDDQLIYSLYLTAFDRTPDKSGFAYWSNIKVAAGVDRDFIVDQFLAAGEFTTVTGGALSDTQFVSRLYQNALERNADTGGLNFWSGLLAANALDRGDVLEEFVTSNEHVTLIGSEFQSANWLLG